MLNLAVPVTPPKPGSKAAEMSPAQFIVSSPTQDSLKRKASLRTVTESQAKRFCLEPPLMSDDTTIAEYQLHVERETLTMMIPFENVWKKIQEKVDNLEEKVSQYSKQSDNLEEKVSKYSKQNDNLEEKVSQYSKQSNDLEEKVSQHSKQIKALNRKLLTL
jgi:peptidoglycan hydrolase CwlO-like protein